MAESAARVSWTTPDTQGNNGERQRARVRQHVSRFGEEGDRVGEKTAHRLDQREGAEDQQRQKQATLACFLGVMMMSVMMAATMLMMMLVPMIVVTVTSRVVVIVPVLM
jgi:hypothetical protein